MTDKEMKNYIYSLEVSKSLGANSSRTNTCLEIIKQLQAEKCRTPETVK